MQIAFQRKRTQMTSEVRSSGRGRERERGTEREREREREDEEGESERICQSFSGWIYFCSVNVDIVASLVYEKLFVQ